MTPAARKWMECAKPDGRIVYAGSRGFGRRAWELCMERAASEGLVRPNAYGEFEITDAGRAALKSAEHEVKP